MFLAIDRKYSRSPNHFAGNNRLSGSRIDLAGVERLLSETRGHAVHDVRAPLSLSRTRTPFSAQTIQRPNTRQDEPIPPGT